MNYIESKIIKVIIILHNLSNINQTTEENKHIQFENKVLSSITLNTEAQ